MAGRIERQPQGVALRFETGRDRLFAKDLQVERQIGLFRRKPNRIGRPDKGMVKLAACGKVAGTGQFSDQQGIVSGICRIFLIGEPQAQQRNVGKRSLAGESGPPERVFPWRARRQQRMDRLDHRCVGKLGDQHRHSLLPRGGALAQQLVEQGESLTDLTSPGGIVEQPGSRHPFAARKPCYRVHGAARAIDLAARSFQQGEVGQRTQGQWLPLCSRVRQAAGAFGCKA